MRYNRIVLNSVWMAPSRTSDRGSVHSPETSRRRNIALYSGSFSACFHFDCLASETLPSRLAAAVSAIFVSDCLPNCPRVPMHRPRWSGDGAVKDSQTSARDWNAILISALLLFSEGVPKLNGNGLNIAVDDDAALVPSMVKSLPAHHHQCTSR